MSTSLSVGVRNALSSLASIGSAAQEAQYRLSTGKRVNSAIDNPVNYFTSGQLNARAASFTSLLDGVDAGIKTLQTASKGLDAITKLVQSAQSTIKQAQGDISSRPVIKGSASIATPASITASGKSAKEVALASKLGGGGTAANATATAPAQLGLAGSKVTLLIQSGETPYLDQSLTDSSTVRTLSTHQQIRRRDRFRRR